MEFSALRRDAFAMSPDEMERCYGPCAKSSCRSIIMNDLPVETRVQL